MEASSVASNRLKSRTFPKGAAKANGESLPLCGVFFAYGNSRRDAYPACYCPDEPGRTGNDGEHQRPVLVFNGTPRSSAISQRWNAFFGYKTTPNLDNYLAFYLQQVKVDQLFPFSNTVEEYYEIIPDKRPLSVGLHPVAHQPSKRQRNTLKSSSHQRQRPKSPGRFLSWYLFPQIYSIHVVHVHLVSEETRSGAQVRSLLYAFARWCLSHEDGHQMLVECWPGKRFRNILRKAFSIVRVIILVICVITNVGFIGVRITCQPT